MPSPWPLPAMSSIPIDLPHTLLSKTTSRRREYIRRAAELKDQFSVRTSPFTALVSNIEKGQKYKVVFYAKADGAINLDVSFVGSEKGEKLASNGELPPGAGVIPRAVKQIFDTFESQNAEYSVKVTFLELYNEEITDLLAPEEISLSFLYLYL
ncbi:hypothetical protein JHK87_048005 [Glycine soja]|nr:hypothetical protein JHK87_048005 [Glycine soja]